MKQVRIVIIGFGGMGSQYARLLRDGEVNGGILTGICCRNAKGQEIIKAEYPQVKLYRNVDEVFEHADEFDAVAVVTPHDTHVPIGKRTFAAGKHLICDKPAGVCTREVKELMEAGDQAGKAFAMIFNVRTRPAFAMARKMIAEEQLGTLTRAVWVCNTWYRSRAYHNQAPWRSTWSGEHGGLLINQCQHFLDIWQWILGMPKEIEASLDFGKYHEIAVDDSVEIRFLYESGLRGTMISSSGDAPGTNRFEIWGTRGRITIEDGERLIFDENVIPIDEFDRINQEVYGKPDYLRHVIELPDEPGAYETVFQNFVNHILQGEPLLASGEDGLKGLQFANGSYLSEWLHQKVELPVDDDLYVEMMERKVQEERAKSLDSVGESSL